MIDFLGILLGDDCFIGANEWFSEWWRHGFLAKVVTASATWGFDGRKLVSGQLTQPQPGPRANEHPQKPVPNLPSHPTWEGLRKICALLHVLLLSS